MGTLELHFDYPRPPLTSNQRLHWRAKASITADVRLATKLLARGIPKADHITVALTWHVNTRHRRDVDNIVPTLKAMCDGLVDAGIIPDDTPNLMTKMMPTINYDPGHKPHMTLIMTL